MNTEHTDTSTITAAVIDNLIRDKIKVSVFLHDNCLTTGYIYRNPVIDELRVDAPTFTVAFNLWDIRLTLGGSSPRIDL